MAITFVSSSGLGYANRQDTILPAPAGILDGDCLILVFLAGRGGVPPTPTPPAGFVEIGTRTDAISSGFHVRTWTYIKIASNESGNYQFVQLPDPCQAWMGVFRGVDTATPQDAVSTAGTGIGTTATWTGLTTASADAMLVAIGHDWGDFANNLSPPAGMTELFDTHIAFVSTELRPTPGATGNRSQVVNNNSTSAWASRLLALRPAALGDTTPPAPPTGLQATIL